MRPEGALGRAYLAGETSAAAESPALPSPVPCVEIDLASGIAAPANDLGRAYLSVVEEHADLIGSSGAGEFLIRSPGEETQRATWIQRSAQSATVCVFPHAEPQESMETKRFQTALEALPIGVWIADETGRIIATNRAGLDIWGGARWIDREEYGEYKAWWASTGKPIEAGEWALARAFSRGEASYGEIIEIETFDGKRKTLRNSAIPVKDESGRLLGAVALNEDITARRDLEISHENIDASFRATFEQAAVGIVQASADGIIRSVNPGFSKMIGRDAASLVGRSVFEITHPEDIELDAQQAQALLRGDRATYTIEKRYLRPDGSSFWAQLTCSLVRDELGRPWFTLKIVQDISDRKKAEQALMESQQALSLAMRASRMGTWVREVRSGSVTWSEDLLSIFGLTAETFAGTEEAFFELVHPEDRPAVAQAVEAAVRDRTDYVVEFRFRHSNGSWLWMEGRGRATYDADGPTFLHGIGLDITERMRVHVALEESASLLRAAVDGGMDSFFVMEAVRDESNRIIDFKFLELNPKGEQLIGIKRERAIGGRLLELLPGNLENGAFERYCRVVETGEPLIEEISNCGAGHVGLWLHQQVVRVRDGVAITASVITDRKIDEQQHRFLVELGDLLREQTSPDGVYAAAAELSCSFFGCVRCDFLEGAEARVASEAAANSKALSVSLSADDRSVFAAVLTREEEREWHPRESDILRQVAERVYAAATKAKAEMQLAALNATLEARVAERTDELAAANEELEGFCYSIAHDLRQPIRGISLNAGMALDDYGDALDDEGRTLLEELGASAKRMSDLVDDLLSYARLNKMEVARAQIDIAEIARGHAERLLARDWPCTEASFFIPESLPACGDADLVGLALGNLLENACKYSRTGQKLSVEVGKRGDAFYIRDDGIGFDMQYASKLFKPFERLHRNADYPGTGIGLANVKRVVERHGGRVWAEGKPNAGATFWFTLADC